MDCHINHNNHCLIATRVGNTMVSTCRNDSNSSLDHYWIYRRNWAVDESYHQRKHEGHISDNISVIYLPIFPLCYITDINQDLLRLR